MSHLPDASDLERLQADAERILGMLDANGPAKPYFVEFSGTPKSGKSTCIDIVSHFFRRVGFKVLFPTEGASRRTPGFLKDDFIAFNTWSASYALTHVLEGLHSPEKYHIAILDRGLFDALAWFQLLEERGDVTADDRQKVQDFLMIENWRSAIDCVFLFRTDPATSLARENANTLTAEPGRAMNSEFLEVLNDAYKTVRREYSPLFPSFTDIDTSKTNQTSPKQTAYEVTRAIVDLMSGKASQ